MTGNPHYSAPFDMMGRTSLRVEARLLDLSPHPATLASVHVQGTDDGKTEKKNWVVEGGEIALPPGASEVRTFHEVRQTVRIRTDADTPGGVGRIEVRLTRLP
jgi:hypothetical protein